MCECVNLKHVKTRRCQNKATKGCTICYAALCGGCAKNHHFHETFLDL